MVRVAASDLEPYLAGLFEAVGVEADEAVVVARSYVSAELAGLASHGVMRIPRIFAGIDAGTHFPSHLPSTVREGVAFAVLDGRSGLGVLVGACAMRLAVRKARAAGIACVAVFNSNHFGTAGYFCRLAAEEQMIGITMCNGEPGVCSPAGTRAVIGPNPIAIGAPTRSKPVVLDMSIASIVRGRVLEYQRTGKALPEGVAIDDQGGPTVDPSAALLGAFLPFGGTQAYKGFGLGVMVDILSGPLVGAAFADRVTGTANTTQDCNKGDLYIAIDVAQFRDYEDYLDDVETLVAVIKSTGESVYLPGEVEDQRAAAAGGTVTLDEDMAAQLSALSRRLGVEPPVGLKG